MIRPQPLTRRSLLADLGRGSLVVAIFGPAAVACAGSSPATASPERTGTVDATTASTEAEAEDVVGDPDSELAWHPVSFGFVSAYLLVRGSDVAIVDTGTRGNADRIGEAITAIDLDWSDVDHVILTHLHGDHVGGLPEVLDRSTTAKAYAGAADVEGIESPRALTPLNDGDEVFGMEIVATPGHTAGHISVLDPAGSILVAGDALNTESGRVLGANPEFTADIGAAGQSIRTLATRRFDTVVVGHGDPVEGEASALVATLAESL